MSSAKYNEMDSLNKRFGQQIIDERYRHRLEYDRLSHSVSEIENFFAVETPEKDHNYNPVEILYQYNPENQKTFRENAKIVDGSMWAVMKVINYVRLELWEREEGKKKSPLNIPTEPPSDFQVQLKEEQQPNALTRAVSRLFNFNAPKESPYDKGEITLSFYEMIPEKWRLLREYHTKAVATKGISWSSVTERSGMESFRKIMMDVYSYWIQSSLLTLFNYGSELKIKEMVSDAKEIIYAQNATMNRLQKENPMMNL